MSYNNCVIPKVRNFVWVVYDCDTDERIGEVAAMTEDEARAIVHDHVKVPFRISHIEE